MQIADGFLLKPTPVKRGEGIAPVARPLVIEPWISPPPDVVVYEFGARLDSASQAAAAAQIQQARQLYNALIGCIRIAHTEMNAWVLERAGPQAQALQGKLVDCEAAIAAAKAGGEVERVHLLAPQRLELGAELTSLLRPVRERHRADLRALFFSRVGNTTSTQTCRLRCQAVDAGLGWASATEVLDSALLAWKKSLALGRARKFVNADRKDQDTLTLQFTLKGGLPVEQVLDGSSQEIHLTPTDAARRRAYGAFRFRLGLARDSVNATGTWQHHRPIPEAAHVACARLVRRSVADKDRWSLQLVLRLAKPNRIDHTSLTDLAAVHFGWTRCEGGRRVATVACSAEPDAALPIVLPALIEGDLDRSAELQANAHWRATRCSPPGNAGQRQAATTAGAAGRAGRPGKAGRAPTHSCELQGSFQQRWLQQVCVNVQQDAGQFQRAPQRCWHLHDALWRAGLGDPGRDLGVLDIGKQIQTQHLVQGFHCPPLLTFCRHAARRRQPPKPAAIVDDTQDPRPRTTHATVSGHTTSHLTSALLARGTDRFGVGRVRTDCGRLRAAQGRAVALRVEPPAAPAPGP